MILPFESVVRSDGTRILSEAESPDTKGEFRRIIKTVTSRLIVLSSLWALWSFFYSGSWSTYLGSYFTVRTRALSSLISPFFCM